MDGRLLVMASRQFEYGRLLMRQVEAALRGTAILLMQDRREGGGVPGDHVGVLDIGPEGEKVLEEAAALVFSRLTEMAMARPLDSYLLACCMMRVAEKVMARAIDRHVAGLDVDEQAAAGETDRRDIVEDLLRSLGDSGGKEPEA